MNEFWNKVVAENSIATWTIVIVVIAVAFLVRKLISQIIANFVIKFFPNKKTRDYKADFKEFISKPLGDLIFLIIAFGALDKLVLPPFFKFQFFKTDLEKIVGALAKIIMVYSVIRFLRGVSKFLFSIWQNRAEDANNKSVIQLISVSAGLINALLIIAGIMVVCSNIFQWNLGAFITSLGIFSAALALAGKESLENLIASFIIFLDKPFYIGDYVTVGSNSGTVETIGLRSCRLRTSDKTLIVVPNKQMVDSVLNNLSSRTQWRYTENLEVTLSATVEQLEMLQDGIRNILMSYEVDAQYVYLKQTGGSCHIIYLEYLISVGKKPSTPDIYALNTSINEDIIRLFQTKGIAFAQESSTVVSIQQPQPTS